MKIKEITMKAGKLWEEFFADYKATIIFLALGVVAGVVGEVWEGAYDFGVMGIWMFLVIYAMSVFLGELSQNGRPVKRAVYYVITGIISFVLSASIHEKMLLQVLSIVPNTEGIIEKIKNPSGFDSVIIRNLMTRVDEYLMGYIILLLIWIFYCGYKKAEVSFSEYISTTFFNMAVVICIYVVLLIGMMLLWGTIETLLLPNIDNYSRVEGIIFIILTGLFFGPVCIWVFTDKKRTLGMAVQSVVLSYIMTGFCVCVMAVGYIYLLRILFIGQMPSNEVFSVIMVLFMLSLPQWLTLETYQEHSVYRKIVSKLPYVFAPLVGLQACSLGIRVGEYGLTPGRYMGVILILFEVIVVIFWKVKRTHLELLLPIMAILIVCSIFIPFTNMYSISAKSQEAFLKEYGPRLRAGEVLEEIEYSRLKGAYNYLRYKPEIRDFSKKYGYIEALMAEGGVIFNKKSYSVHGCQMVGTLDTTGYTKMHMLNQSSKYDVASGENSMDIDFAKFELYIRETGEVVIVDLSKVYEAAIAYDMENPDGNSEQDSEYLKKYNKIVIDENRVFYVNHFKISYKVEHQGEEVDLEIRNVEISGMLLEK